MWRRKEREGKTEDRSYTLRTHREPNKDMSSIKRQQQNYMYTTENTSLGTDLWWSRALRSPL